MSFSVDNILVTLVSHGHIKLYDPELSSVLFSVECYQVLSI